jgi:polyisoprenoid-binding protein YceI
MATEKWNFDTVHSTVAFSVRHLMISKVHGTFKKWSGSLLYDDGNPTAHEIDVKIETASIDTREEQRDAHLRSADFFDVEKYPEMTFTSTAVAAKGGDEYEVTGNLTLHGVTKPVKLRAEHLGRGKDPWGGERMGFTASGSIDRKDFGLTFNMPLDGGGVMVGDKIEIHLDVEAVKEVAASA